MWDRNELANSSHIVGDIMGQTKSGIAGIKFNTVYLGIDIVMNNLGQTAFGNGIAGVKTARRTG